MNRGRNAFGRRERMGRRPTDFCDKCGKLCFGDKGTAEEKIQQPDGTIICGECAEEAEQD